MDEPRTSILMTIWHYGESLNITTHESHGFYEFRSFVGFAHPVCKTTVRAGVKLEKNCLEKRARIAYPRKTLISSLIAE